MALRSTRKSIARGRFSPFFEPRSGQSEGGDISGMSPREEFPTSTYRRQPTDVSLLPSAYSRSAESSKSTVSLMSPWPELGRFCFVLGPQDRD
jgi:hypothetical protein